ncbi:hypothetical protein BV25DRAFT_1835425 [Artomyces pyxidatus]|uniref:Uncharacterized protein n=1 Tax=Artomyces pyxidatus TaxID=48021 RepID=A0ACB8TFB9_9AGAM|nr:hypothetical protein BV25DRAFT_1835425 [Artomyces pyxidatus]
MSKHRLSPSPGRDVRRRRLSPSVAATTEDCRCPIECLRPVLEESRHILVSVAESSSDPSSFRDTRVLCSRCGVGRTLSDERDKIAFASYIRRVGGEDAGSPSSSGSALPLRGGTSLHGDWTQSRLPRGQDDTSPLIFCHTDGREQIEGGAGPNNIDFRRPSRSFGTRLQESARGSAVGSVSRDVNDSGGNAQLDMTPSMFFMGGTQGGQAEGPARRGPFFVTCLWFLSVD